MDNNKHNVSAVFYLSRHWRSPPSYGPLRLADDEAGKLMADHIPATLLFQDVSYYVGEKQVLNSIHGMVRPGEVMAIMGGSGAGKTTFLDILARKNKAGVISGEIYVNGRTVEDEIFKKVVGYVDQEDHLLSTLTVYETVLYSALLRLPREMSFEAKRFRVLETMSELGILAIKDSRIGDAGTRSISGGEKRRVSIACELVTSPSILFLDEPTSGLDAYNAYNTISAIRNRASIHDIQDLQLYSPHRPQTENSTNNTIPIELNNRDRRNADSPDVEINGFGDEISEHLRMLVTSYRRSLIALGIKDEIDRAVHK
ncbi:9460_t:CDS:2 [Acaulospora colombiana]|uniref:9460_t:CDS:1 n=1 Tax=Acaulospora colombiana TaxID=27376 RepID=A0ACA9K9L7_9GLOM|nr:9460_t:CDS:2 [Acaulospora colombiana]